MYAFHWYSLVGGWISDGDWASEVQFAPNDPAPYERFLDFAEFGDRPFGRTWSRHHLGQLVRLFAHLLVRAGTLRRGHAARSPASGARPSAQVSSNRDRPRLQPSSKAMMWERFDTTKKQRTETGIIAALSRTAKKPPTWHNPGATPVGHDGRRQRDHRGHGRPAPAGHRSRRTCRPRSGR
jgi:hypothetical protein